MTEKMFFPQLTGAESCSIVLYGKLQNCHWKSPHLETKKLWGSCWDQLLASKKIRNEDQSDFLIEEIFCCRSTAFILLNKEF